MSEKESGRVSACVRWAVLNRAGWCVTSVSSALCSSASARKSFVASSSTACINMGCKYIQWSKKNEIANISTKPNHHLVLRAAHSPPSANPCGLQVANVDAGRSGSAFKRRVLQRTRCKRLVPQRARERRFPGAFLAHHKELGAPPRDREPSFNLQTVGNITLPALTTIKFFADKIFPHISRNGCKHYMLAASKDHK